MYNEGVSLAVMTRGRVLVLTEVLLRIDCPLQH